MSHSNDVPIFEDEEEDEGPEMPPLEYARQNGIARDYLNDVTTSFQNVTNLIMQHVEDTIDDDPNLPIFSFGPELRLEERMTLTQDAAKLLSAIARPDSIEGINLVASKLLDSRHRKKLLLELPLLKWDHERDCKEFVRRDKFEIRLQDIRLPFELVDDEKGEGLGWPKTLRAYGPSIVEKLKKEKLMVKRNTMTFIQASVSAEWTTKDQKNLWDSEQKYQRTKIKEPLTPIELSPVIPSMPYKQDTELEGFDMPILSDPSDLTRQDLEVIEKRIFEKDVPTPIRDAAERAADRHMGDGTVSMKDIYSPLISSSQSPQPEEEKRFRPEDYKVEPPLVPELPIDSPTNVVRFSDIILQPDFDLRSPSNSDGLEGQFFEDAILAHERVTRQSEQEQLVHADALSRVDIPKMDFSLPDPPWKDLSDARNSKLLRELQHRSIAIIIYQSGTKPTKWLGVQKVDDQLKWGFPTTLAQNAMQERFPEAEEVLLGFVGNLKDENVVDSSALIWKPEGLRILKDEDDDDEIEPAKFIKPPPADMSSLVKKRKMLIEEETVRNQQANPTVSSEAGPSRVTSKKARTESSTNPLEDTVIGNLLGGTFSARAAVDNLMEMNGAKSLSFSPNVDLIPNRQLVPSPRQLQPNLPLRKSPLLKKVDFPIPKFDIPTTPFYVIMSTTMYKKRDLVKSLERTLPTLTLIERDFTAHNTTSWLAGSVNRSPIVSPLAAEADFIASPSLGIIITTLPKIASKPPPNSKEPRSEIRIRVEQVSLRYENLLILVSEENKNETTNGLVSYYSQALAGFIGATAGLDCNVTVQFVPGGDQILSKWLMSAIVQHRSAEELLADQTHWELFLRRAGMNAFAAQVVIAQMKAPEGVNGSSPSKAGYFGLTGFVEMAKEERVTRFEGLCGRKLLRRVSAAIEMNWG